MGLWGWCITMDSWRASNMDRYLLLKVNCCLDNCSSVWMHYTATTWSRCHSDCTTHLWEGAQTPLCQQRQALSLQCSDFLLLYPPPRCLCSLLGPPAPHVNQMHVTGFTASLSMAQERTLTLAPTTAGSVWCCNPGAAHLPNTSTAIPEPEMGCRSCSTLTALSKMFISMAWLLARAAVDVFACLGGTTGSARCEGAPLSWGSCSSQGRLYWKQSWRKRSQVDSKTQSPGWAIFVSLSNPDFQTAGDRPSIPWGWHNLGIFF